MSYNIMEDNWHCCFVSGHRDITKEEFDEHYIPNLIEGIKRNSIFVIGDYHGADEMAQKYLKDQGYPDSHIRVYHMLKNPRVCHSSFKIGGFKSDEQRDSAMTLASTKDIAWVRPGKENSGTAQNLARRQKDYLMCQIQEKICCLNKSVGFNNKFDKFFHEIQDHIEKEWKKVSGQFIEERLGDNE